MDVLEKMAKAIGDYGTSHFGTPYDEQDRMAKAMRRGEAKAALAVLSENVSDEMVQASRAARHEGYSNAPSKMRQNDFDAVERKAISAALLVLKDQPR